MRLGIDGVADRGEFAEHLAWVAILEQRAVAAPADALDEGRDVGVEPQRQAVLQDQCACLVVDEGAAAGREDQWPTRAQPRDHPALAIAEMSFAEARRAEEHKSELRSIIAIQS